MKKKSLYLYSVMIVTLLLGLSACLNSGSVDPGLSPNTESLRKAPGIENDANGTSDGGGGFIEYSTDGQIKDAVEFVRSIMLKEGFEERLLGRSSLSTFERFFESDETGRLAVRVYNVYERIRLPKAYAMTAVMDDLEYKENFDTLDWYPPYVDDQIRKVERLEKYIERWEYAKNLPEDLNQYLPNIPILYEESGPCLHAANYGADASVSDYSFDAILCFSLPRLRRIPPAALEAHIFGLWLHELVHMTGEKSEEIANALERFGVKSYQKLVFGNVTERLRIMTGFYMWSSWNLLQNLKVQIHNYYNPIDENELYAIESATISLRKTKPLIGELEFVAKSPGQESNSIEFSELLKLKRKTIMQIGSNASIFLTLVDPFPAADVFPDIMDINRRKNLFERSQLYGARIDNIIGLTDDELFMMNFYEEIDFLYEESEWLRLEFKTISEEAFGRRTSDDFNTQNLE